LKSVAEICDPRILDQDSSRHAYPTNTGVDFTFSRDATRQRRASTFRLLLDGSNDEVVQGARRREIDNKVSNMSDKPLSISRAVKWRRRGEPVQISADMDGCVAGPLRCPQHPVSNSPRCAPIARVPLPYDLEACRLTTWSARLLRGGGSPIAG